MNDELERNACSGNAVHKVDQKSRKESPEMTMIDWDGTKEPIVPSWLLLAHQSVFRSLTPFVMLSLGQILALVLKPLYTGCVERPRWYTGIVQF